MPLRAEEATDFAAYRSADPVTSVAIIEWLDGRIVIRSCQSVLIVGAIAVELDAEQRDVVVGDEPPD